MAERNITEKQTASFRQHAAAETQSKMFDHIAGKNKGPLANAKLRAEIDRLTAELKEARDRISCLSFETAGKDFNGDNEQLASEK